MDNPAQLDVVVAAACDDQPVALCRSTHRGEGDVVAHVRLRVLLREVDALLAAEHDDALARDAYPADRSVLAMQFVEVGTQFAGQADAVAEQGQTRNVGNRLVGRSVPQWCGGARSDETCNRLAQRMRRVQLLDDELSLLPF